MTHKLTPGQVEHHMKWSKIYTDSDTWLRDRGYSTHIAHIKLHALRQMKKAYEVYGLTTFTDLGKVDLYNNG